MPRPRVSAPVPVLSPRERAVAGEQIERARWALDEQWKPGGGEAQTDALIVSWRVGRQRVSGLLVDLDVPLPPEVPAITRLLGGNPELSLHRAAAASGMLRRADLAERNWRVMAAVMRHLADDRAALLGGDHPISPAGRLLSLHNRYCVPLHLRRTHEYRHDWGALRALTQIPGVPCEADEAWRSDRMPSPKWPWHPLPVNVNLQLRSLPPALQLWADPASAGLPS